MKIAMHQITSRKATLEEDLAAYVNSGWSAFEFHPGKAGACLDGGCRKVWPEAAF